MTAGLVLLVAVAYVQVFRFEFVNYDDTLYVPDNPQVRTGFSLHGIGWAFTTYETANWYPLTWLSLMLDCQIFGPWAGGQHAVNAALHAANSVLLFMVLRRTTGSRWRSAAVAALFAVHPLHVESVAWIAERKDVLSTLFFLLTLWAYHRYVASPRFSRWLLVFLVMALGLMAKSMLVTLPAVLLLLDFWPLNRPRAGESMSVAFRSAKERNFRGAKGDSATVVDSPIPTGSVSEDSSLMPRVGFHYLLRRDRIPGLLLEKLPFLALSLAIAVVTVAAQASKGATAMLHDRANLPVRLANAAIAIVKYLAMTIWPARLAVYYPYNFHPSPWLAVSAALLLLVLTSAAVWCLIESGRHGTDGHHAHMVGLVSVPSAKVAGTLRVPSAQSIRLLKRWWVWKQQADGTRRVPATLYPLPSVGSGT